MTTRAEGTGLGLPIVVKIFEDHGGGLELLDAPAGRRRRACRLNYPLAMAAPPHRRTCATAVETRRKL